LAVYFIVDDFAAEFHEYAIEWNAERIRFFVDGRRYYAYDPANKNGQNWPFDDGFFIIINIAMGGNFGSDPQYETNNQRNGVDPELELARMEVDYVRVYQEVTSPLQIAGDTIVNAGEVGLQYEVEGIAVAEFEWSVSVKRKTYFQTTTKITGQFSGLQFSGDNLLDV